MTIMVKPNVAGQKQAADVMVMPLIDIEEPERPATRPPRKLPATPARPQLQVIVRAMMLLACLSALITVFAFVTGMLITDDLFKSYNKLDKARYRGSCAIASTDDVDYVVVKEPPSTASWFSVPTAEMRVYSSASDLIGANILNNLLEDMSIADDVEHIYVHDGPRTFSIVHDFNENYTNIISQQRCFLMEMIRQFVLEPQSLIASFHNDSSLELSHAHTVFRAELPAVGVAGRGPARYPAVTRPCLDDNKPVYRLSLEDTHVLRKRSVEVRSTPAPLSSAPRASSELARNDFVQFSGKHLQRITVSNLDDVLRYEQVAATGALQHPHPKVSAGHADE